MPLDYPLAERTLANGLHVIVSSDHAAPTVAVNLWYDVGSRHEVAGRTGFAHLFEHLMFSGSAHVAASEHIAAMQAAGASVNATTWFDRTNYFEALPLGGLDLALWLEADRLATLLEAVTQQNLDNQREVVKEEKRQRYDNVPYGDMLERLVRLAFPADHPYGHTTIGAMADLDAASLADVHAFFTDHYMPNNAVISLVGDISPDDGFARVERYFGTIPARDHVRRGDADPLPPLAGLPRDEVHADVPADAVHLCWRVPAAGTPAYDAVDLALAVLGTGRTSRLHQALVRTGELAERATANSFGLVAGTSLGYASARCRDGVAPDRLEAALLAEVQRLVDDGPTAAELDAARAQFERSWLQTLARVDGRADQLSGHHTLYGDASLINRRIDQIAAVTADDVATAARTWLSPEQRGTLVYRTEAS